MYWKRYFWKDRIDLVRLLVSCWHTGSANQFLLILYLQVCYINFSSGITTNLIDPKMLELGVYNDIAHL